MFFFSFLPSKICNGQNPTQAIPPAHSTFNSSSKASTLNQYENGMTSDNLLIGTPESNAQHYYNIIASRLTPCIVTAHPASYFS